MGRILRRSGGARSGYWGRTLAAALDVELAYLHGGEVGPALGAARLAQVAVDGGAPQDVCTSPPVARLVTPEPALRSRLADKYQAFKNAYSRITPLGTRAR